MFVITIISYKHGKALPINSEFQTNIRYVIEFVALWRVPE